MKLNSPYDIFKNESKISRLKMKLLDFEVDMRCLVLRKLNKWRAKGEK